MDVTQSNPFSTPAVAAAAATVAAALIYDAAFFAAAAFATAAAGHQQVASISGTWQGAVYAESPEGSGGWHWDPHCGDAVLLLSL